jgi:hypothetical protein
MGYSLGPLPWDQDKLRELYYKDWQEAFKAIREHPGYESLNLFNEVTAALEIFVSATDTFLTATADFRNAAQSPSFWYRPSESILKQKEKAIRNALFVVVASALALVGPATRSNDKLRIHECENKKSKYFRDNERHRFVQGLRNAMLHKTLFAPAWQRSFKTGQEVKTSFLLTDTMLQSYDWGNEDKLARQFIARHLQGIDIEAVIIDYKSQVLEFYEWFCSEFKKRTSTEIDDYLQYEKFLKGILWRDTWRALLRTAIDSNVDPHLYMDRYLTQQELDGINKFPKASRESVDLMISILDKYNMRDDEIRTLAYKLFKVN